jgi:hypothetical protein
MALPRFSFSGGATDFFQPNQALFRTTFTPSDKLQSDTYQAEAKAYKDAVEKHNEALKVNPNVDPPKPTPLSFTQEEFDQFGVDASRRAQQLQNAKQNTFNAISNPSGFSQQYGIGSLGFEEGGEVPVNFVGTGEFPETDPSVGYRTGPASQKKELPLAAELLVDFTPVVGDVKAGIEAADYFNKGEYGNAALAGVGVLPFVPPLVGMAKKVKGLTVDSLKRKPTLQAPENSNPFEVLGITKDSKEAWRNANKLPNKNKPPEENRQALIEQVKLLEEGKSTPDEFRRYVDTKTPYFLHDSVPEVDSFERIANSLPQESSILRHGIIGVNKQIPEGTLVGSRYDVRAFENYGTYVGTIHDPAKHGNVLGYSPTAALKNVVFETKVARSLKIAKGNERLLLLEWKETG